MRLARPAFSLRLSAKTSLVSCPLLLWESQTKHHACACILLAKAWRCASAEDAACMARALDLILTSSTSQAVCCQLAASTSIRAFEILCANCEDRGLVFVHSAGPEKSWGRFIMTEIPPGNMKLCLVTSAALWLLILASSPVRPPL